MLRIDENFCVLHLKKNILNNTIVYKKTPTDYWPLCCHITSKVSQASHPLCICTSFWWESSHMQLIEPNIQVYTKFISDPNSTHTYIQQRWTSTRRYVHTYTILPKRLGPIHITGRSPFGVGDREPLFDSPWGLDSMVAFWDFVLRGFCALWLPCCAAHRLCGMLFLLRSLPFPCVSQPPQWLAEVAPYAWADGQGFSSISSEGQLSAILMEGELLHLSYR